MRNRSRAFLAVVSLATASCAAGAAVTASGGVAPATSRATSVRDGVFTQAQAQRGAAGYEAACSSCHSSDLRGNSNAPSLVGVSFTFLWEDKSLDDLYTTIRTLMPTNAPGSLSAISYLEIVAYILEANGFPAGAAELVADPAVLARISIGEG